jgi:hypothetical protein
MGGAGRFLDLREQRCSTEACDAIMRMRNADERLKKK